MESEALVINGSPVTSLIVNSTLKYVIANHHWHCGIDKLQSSPIPQGSLLPILCLIYINNISNSTSLNLLSFADDATIYQSAYDIGNLTTTVNQ